MRYGYHFSKQDPALAQRQLHGEGSAWSIRRSPESRLQARRAASSQKCDRGGTAAVEQRCEATWDPRRLRASLEVLAGCFMAGFGQSGGARALDLLRALPRVSLANLKPNPGSRKPVNSWWRCGAAQGDGGSEAALPPGGSWVVQGVEVNAVLPSPVSP